MKPGKYVPAALAIIAGLTFQIRAQGNTVSSPRIAPHADEGFTRVVLEVPGTVRFTTALGPKSLSFTLAGQPASAASGTADTDELAAWSLARRGNDSVLTLRTTFDVAPGRGYKAFTLEPEDGVPRRFVVDVGPKLVSATAAVVTPIVAATTAKPAAKAVVPQRATVSAAPKRPAPVVVLDPGHGGVDSGAVGYVVEKQVTLDIALKTRALLEQRGVKVLLTRTGDADVVQKNGSIEEKRRDLQARSAYATVQRNVFVSIHVNSSTSTAPHGVETYYFGETLDPSILAQADRENGGGNVGRALTLEARNLARDIVNSELANFNLKFSQRLASTVQAAVVNATGALNRGTATAPFYVIRTARIPAILVETGFARHPSEGKSLATAAYRQKLASGIAAGVLSFLNVQ